MTTFQMTILTDIFSNILVRQDWNNQEWKDYITGADFSNLITEINKLSDSDNIIKKSYEVVGLNQ